MASARRRSPKESRGARVGMAAIPFLFLLYVATKTWSQGNRGKVVYYESNTFTPLVQLVHLDRTLHGIGVELATCGSGWRQAGVARGIALHVE